MKWLRTNDVIPNKDMDVLCVVNDEYPEGDFTVIPMIYAEHGGTYGFFAITVNGLVETPKNEIHYWRPLPKPPKQ